MYLNKLTTKILTLKDKTLDLSEFPDKIFPPSDRTGGMLGFFSENIFWKNIKNLRKFTDSGSKNFSSEYSGSTGWEYEMMMVKVNDQYFYSNPTTSKNYTQVSSSHKLNIEPRNSGELLIDDVFINKRQVGKIVYRKPEEISARNQAIRDGKFQVGFVCHFHSHPRVQKDKTSRTAGDHNADENIYYTFFSPQDIYALLSGSTPLMGLVTDRLWLIGKTAQTRQKIKSDPTFLDDLVNDLANVSYAEQESWEQMQMLAAEFFEKYHFAGYIAEFGGTLRRLRTGS